MKDFLSTLKQTLHAHANAAYAVQQKAYMKDLFPFIGIKTPLRRDLCKPFLQSSYLPPKKEAIKIIKALWLLPEREFQYFAQELLYKYIPLFEIDDIELIEWLLIHKSWWDTVDFIAAKIAGAYFNKFPKQIKPVTARWMQSRNIWLQRTCVLFQLKYKKEVDTFLLSYFIQQLQGSKEFFINKAIGWMLREYAKTNTAWVIQFVEKNTLNNLSKSEALKRHQTLQV